MCGIVGYVGPNPAIDFLLEGLTQLEYRGYDSAGVAVSTTNTAATVVKTVGRVADLRAKLPKKLTGTVGIGHTRWATHGPATQENAHPHASACSRYHVVHNGIIDNSASLRVHLAEQGIEFVSDTDTEVIGHLLALTDAPDLKSRLQIVVEQISGTYALAVIDTQEPDVIVVARLGSPLILGVGDKEMFVASDPGALVRHTSQVVYLEDGEMACVRATGYTTFTKEAGDTHRAPTTLDLAASDVSRGEFEHYMLKEILEQPHTAAQVLQGRLDTRFGTVRLDGLNLSPRELRDFTRVKFLGCGSAYYIGQVGAELVEQLARIPADAEPASEFRYRNPVIDPKTLYVVISQSGETADTAFAVEEIKRKGAYVVGLVNVVGSTIARNVHGGIYLHAGPEISVASTKALTNMGIAAAMLAIYLGRVRDLSHADGVRLLAGLQLIPDTIDGMLQDHSPYKTAASTLAEFDHTFFVGRVQGYPVAREGAQKLKEISYIHAEAYPTSELKHGPLALINPKMPTVAIVPDDELTDRNLAAVQQILARKGICVVVRHDTVDLPEDLKGDNVLQVTVPPVEPELDPLLMMIPLQLIAYYTATALGRDIDKPRNLAKSVTVE